MHEIEKKRRIELVSVLGHQHCSSHSLLKDIKDFLPVLPTFTFDFGEIRVLLRNLEVSRILAQDKRLYSLSVMDKNYMYACTKKPHDTSKVKVHC